MSDFTPARISALRAAVALAAGGLSPELVTISITPASVKITAVIHMPSASSTVVQTRAEALRADLRTAARASTVLGVTVIDTPAVLDVTPNSSLTGASPGIATGTYVAIGVVVAALVVALCTLYYRRYCNRSQLLLLDHHMKQGNAGLNAMALSGQELELHGKGYMAANI